MRDESLQELSCKRQKFVGHGVAVVWLKTSTPYLSCGDHQTWSPLRNAELSARCRHAEGWCITLFRWEFVRRIFVDT